jgi:hypothetical protein
MRYIKNFALFESVRLKEFDLSSIFDVETFMDYLAFFENERIKANGYKDFRRWLVYTCLKNQLTGGTYDFLEHQMEGREDELKSKLVSSDEHNPENFDFSLEVEKYPEMKKIMESISSCLFSAGLIKGLYDKPIKDCVTKVYSNYISEVLENIFWPGYLKNIEHLKCLDLLDEEARRSYGIDNSISNSLDRSLNNYNKMEKDRNSLTKKFISLLEEIGQNKIRTFEEVIFPPLMDEVIVSYFSSSDTETFKKADQIRNANIPLFDKIKNLLPNIETAADLGDLGF